ncbi:DEAD/DEAH box helicase [Streptomyces sp. BI20]|uniref:DEAD/DEAH box helicase n=1 Tax=Streptomyces sp. BI20 TaxID=3403460 RepID=UPI003C7644B8
MSRAPREGQQPRASAASVEAGADPSGGLAGDSVDPTAEAVTGTDAAREEVVTDAVTVSVEGPVGSFADLGLPAAVLETLTAQGIVAPFPIQAAAIPVALADRDVLGRARTGSGKTLAFGLPLLTRLAGQKAGPSSPTGLVLVPTRELAQQVAEALEPFAKALGLRMAAAVGGLPINKQVAALRAGVEVLVATPGRLTELTGKNCSLERVRVTVLDEADRMADMGFLPQVSALLEQVPTRGRRMLFSATLDADVAELVSRHLSEPVTVAVDPTLAGEATDSAHHLFAVDAGEKFLVAGEIAARQGRTLMFLGSRLGVDRFTRQLKASGLNAAALHSGKSQPQRTHTLERFRDRELDVLVATDVAARGLHVEDLELVVNVDPPSDPKDYLHRAGRTGRAGGAGLVVTLVTAAQRREVSEMLKKAGVGAGVKVTNARLGGKDVARITGARPVPDPKGAAAGGRAPGKADEAPARGRDGGRAAEKGSSLGFRGIGKRTGEAAKAGKGQGGRRGAAKAGGARNTAEAKMLAEARKAAEVRKNNR